MELVLDVVRRRTGLIWHELWPEQETCEACLQFHLCDTKMEGQWGGGVRRSEITKIKAVEELIVINHQRCSSRKGLLVIEPGGLRVCRKRSVLDHHVAVCAFYAARIQKQRWDCTVCRWLAGLSAACMRCSNIINVLKMETTVHHTFSVLYVCQFLDTSQVQLVRPTTN